MLYGNMREVVKADIKEGQQRLCPRLARADPRSTCAKNDLWRRLHVCAILVETMFLQTVVLVLFQPLCMVMFCGAKMCISRHYFPEIGPVFAIGVIAT